MRHCNLCRKLILWMWTSFVGVFIRKVINTFRPTANVLGRLQGGQEKIKKDALKWMHEGHYQSDDYSSLDTSGRALVDYVCNHAKDHESILDICCNQGRFLLELRRRGFVKLHGFDVMGAAIQKLKQSKDYDGDLIHVEHCLAQEYFANKGDKCFDWAITYTATIELIHPEFDIFRELGRTANKGMVLVLNENGHSYPRFYRLLHWMNGFKIVATRKLAENIVLIHSVKMR